MYVKSPHLVEIELDDGSYVLYNRKNRREVYLGRSEFRVLSMLDGTIGVEELYLDDIAFSKAQIIELLGLFDKHRLLASNTSDIKMISLINYIPFFKSTKLYDLQDGLKRHIGTAVLIGIIFSLFLLSLLIGNNGLFSLIINQFKDSPTILTVTLLFLFSMVHEIGHGVAALIVKFPVVEIGLKTFLVFPLGMYTTICGLKKDKIGWRTFFASSGGIIANTLVIGILIFIVLLQKKTSIVMSTAIFINVFLVAINSLFIYPFDGSIILSSIWGKINYREIDYAKVIGIAIGFIFITIICLMGRLYFKNIYISALYLILNFGLLYIGFKRTRDYKLLTRLASIADLIYFLPLIAARIIENLEKLTLPFPVQILRFIILLFCASIIVLIFSLIRKIILNMKIIA